MDTEDLHQLLGISQNASPKVFRKAFARFARKNHPDFFPGDKIKEERFKKATCQYQNWKQIQATINEIRRLKKLQLEEEDCFSGNESPIIDFKV